MEIFGSKRKELKQTQECLFKRVPWYSILIDLCPIWRWMGRPNIPQIQFNCPVIGTKKPPFNCRSFTTHIIQSIKSHSKMADRYLPTIVWLMVNLQYVPVCFTLCLLSLTIHLFCVRLHGIYSILTNEYFNASWIGNLQIQIHSRRNWLKDYWKIITALWTINYSHFPIYPIYFSMETIYIYRTPRRIHFHSLSHSIFAFFVFFVGSKGKQ